MLESISIGDLPESTNPVEKAGGKSYRPLPVVMLASMIVIIRLLNVLLTQRAQICSWSIVSTVRFAQDQEDGDVDQSKEKCGNESRYQPRKRGFGVISGGRVGHDE